MWPPLPPNGSHNHNKNGTKDKREKEFCMFTYRVESIIFWVLTELFKKMFFA